MARKWTDGDSARLMTNKYNETAEEVSDLSKKSVEINEKTQEELNKIQEELNKKLEEVTVEDLGLEQVDNTPDMKKPVSEAQARAIGDAVEPMITSEVASEVEAEEVGFITSISVQGTKLIISF